MIHSYGHDSYAQGAAEWGGYWNFGPIKNLATGQIWDSGLVLQDQVKSTLLTWDGANPFTQGTNAAYASIISMGANPIRHGPRIP